MACHGRPSSNATSPKIRDLATRDPDLLRRVTDAARLAHAAIRHVAFHNFVAKQRKHAPAQKERPRVPVPIDTRSAARIVGRFLRLRAEFANLFKMERVVAQKQDRGRLFKEVTIAGAYGDTDW